MQNEQPKQQILHSPINSKIIAKMDLHNPFRVTTKSNKPVSIPKPESTNFDVISDYPSHEDIITVTNVNSKFIKHCFDKLYRNNSTLHGKLVVKFDVHPKGFVIEGSIKVIESNIQDTRIIQCIKRDIRRWRNLPQLYEKNVYSITQKFVF